MPAPRGNKHALGNNGGRPTDYKPEFAEQAKKLCLLGATDKELADFFEVVESTINLWKVTHLEFSEAIKAGKDLADAEVAEKLYRRATGYSHADVDIKMYEGQIIETSLTKHYPPDTAAAIIWLKNRQKTKWRDRYEQEVSIPQGLTITYKNQSGNDPLPNDS